jgi:capsular exopolysaccharide synthesis family protein
VKIVQFVRRIDLPFWSAFRRATDRLSTVLSPPAKIADPAVFSESFRSLYSSIVLSCKQFPKSILVTSVAPEDGKSTVVSYLALSLARSGKKVLLVDADLRRPALHRIFQIDDGVGLDGLLSRQDGGLPLLPVARSGVDIVCGSTPVPDPLPLLWSDGLKRFIESVTAVYDVVLLDSPPVLAVNDAACLAPLVRGVILVLKAGSVGEREAKRAKALLEQSGGTIVGTVLNRFDDRFGPGSYPYRSRYD